MRETMMSSCQQSAAFKPSGDLLRELALRSDGVSFARSAVVLLFSSVTACLGLRAETAPASAGQPPAAGAGADFSRALETYVKAEDGAFQWKVAGEIELPGKGVALVVRLVSQTWRDTRWEHWLTVLRPGKVTHGEHALLVIAGGSSQSSQPTRLNAALLVLAQVAERTGSVVAAVAQVPNQPLLGDLKEDALIALTFKKFLETRDPTWPCLLPMTKSAVKAMDAVQAIARDKFSQDIKSFVVTGASKRGWTTWLAGAVDPRVAAIAPQVIDTLNFKEQMELQVKSFGGYSEQIDDYTRLDLPAMLQQPRSNDLVAIVDPYSYRKRLAMPKLIVLGTNDRYWPADAVKLYFGGLEGEKHINYIPNTGHDLGAAVVPTLSAFYNDVIRGAPRPRFAWSLRKEKDGAVLAVVPQDAPLKADLWRASAPTRDFRDSRWNSSPMARGPGGQLEGKVVFPEKGFAACFGQLTYKSALEIEYTLSTNIEVLGD